MSHLPGVDGQFNVSRRHTNLSSGFPDVRAGGLLPGFDTGNPGAEIFQLLGGAITLGFEVSSEGVDTSDDALNTPPNGTDEGYESSNG
jgi:hypothetical protein